MPSSTRLLLLLVVGACRASSTAPRVQYMERLDELFRSLRTTHGGPAYVSKSGLEFVRREAEERLQEASTLGEDTYLAVCAWAMAQLADPLSSHLRPLQAIAARERFHGRVGLGLTLKTIKLRCGGGTGGDSDGGGGGGSATVGDTSTLHTQLGRWWRRVSDRRSSWRRASMVSAVEDGSAAARGGLRVGDELLQVGGLSISQQETRRAALDLLEEGPEGEAVAVAYRRPDAAGDSSVRLTRTPVPLSTVRWHPLQCSGLVTGVAHVVAISTFGSHTADELKAALRRLRRYESERRGNRSASADAPRATTIVFDLRGNEGGLLPEAIAASRMVLPRGAHILSLCKEAPDRRVVKTFRRRWYHRNELPAHMAKSHPLIVLVNHASASSAEVFAAALAHSGGAVVVGQQTYGKGSSQAVVYQSDGHAISFTAYTLAVGNGRRRVPLSHGVEPRVRWRWRANAALSTDLLEPVDRADSEEVRRAIRLAAAEPKGP